MFQRATDRSHEINSRSCLQRGQASLQVQVAAGSATPPVERARHPGGCQQTYIPHAHSAAPHLLAIRLDARRQDLACENESAPSGIPHFRERHRRNTNRFGKYALFPNPLGSTQVRKVAADSYEI